MEEDTKIYVDSIKNIISYLYQKSFIRRSTLVILISDDFSKYDTSLLPINVELLQFNFLDVRKGEEGFITDKDVKKIENNYNKLMDCYDIYVACDGGISRSPAFALAIAHLLGLENTCMEIRYRHRFLNEDVFYYIMEKLDDNFN